MASKRLLEESPEAEQARKLQKTAGCGQASPTPRTAQQQGATSGTAAAAQPEVVQHGQEAAAQAGSDAPNAGVRASSSSAVGAASSSGLQSLPLRFAVSSDKGPRATMEDVHVCVAAQQDDPDDNNRVWHFALYDGHGGVQCATFASQQLHTAVLAAGLLTHKGGQSDPQSAEKRTGKGAASAAQPPAASATAATAGFQLDVKAAKQAVVQGFTATDEQLLQECAQHSWSDGATCVAVWLVGSTALVANIGDAKAVLARRPQQGSSSSQGKAGAATSASGSLRALVLTKDHLAMYPEERTRIERAGGHVTPDGRLNGRMQVSRSFGDAQFKPSGCSAVPAVVAFSVGPRESFLLAACDGFWSVMDPQGAVDLAAQVLQQGKDTKAATNRLLHEAVTERRCKDNCSVMLVVFDGE